MTTKMKTKTKTDRKARVAMLALLSATLLTASACSHSVRLDTRTYQLKHLDEGEAQNIVRPYVYRDRKDGPKGEMSTSPGILTVRETPDNLDKIQRVLEQYDVPRADVRLHFQLIEADHFTDTDPAIAPVEAQLRKIFQFKGYRLVGEAVVGATNGSTVAQRLPGGYNVGTRVLWNGPSTLQLVDVSLSSNTQGPLLRTTVNIHPGQTLVVGSAAEGGRSTATLLLTLRAEEAETGPTQTAK
jgi:hypothetical protein